MKDFFKFMFASMVGTILSALVVIFLVGVIIAGAVASAFDDISSDKVTNVKTNSILKIELENPIVDRAEGENFNFRFGAFDFEGKMGLNNIINDIEKAKEDDNIKGIYMNVSNVSCGFSSVEEIRQALLSFKESGKWIMSYSETYSQKAYYLASVADEIYLYPEGGIDYRGIGTQVMFFEGLLEKIDVEAQVIRGSNNKFKSAVEPFIMDEMSQANRLQTEKWVGSIWNTVVSGISESRGISVEELNNIADEYKIQFAADAVTYGLATAVAYEDEVLQKMMAKVDVDETEDLNFVSLNNYHKAPGKPSDSVLPSFKQSKIAVIYASGSINSGESEDETIGSETVAKAIAKARKDSTVKAIVLRVNSPGGSALASDVIWRETVLAKEAKPFVVSMGDVAASGGYYIACAADKIYALPNTITGSIGVFGIIPNMKGLFNNKLGITFDGVKTNKFADFAETTRPLTEEEHRIIQNSVDEIYLDFTTKVAKGRDIPVTTVDSIGQGRVWAGSDAMDIGLIDEFGGLNAAIKGAAELAGLEEYKLKELPEPKDPFQEIIEQFSTQAQVRITQNLTKDYEMLQMFNYVQELKQMKGIQTRLPFYLNVN